jgi:hypothetical protein
MILAEKENKTEKEKQCSECTFARLCGIKICQDSDAERDKKLDRLHWERWKLYKEEGEPKEEDDCKDEDEDEDEYNE